eukprot:3042918-Alexandrium_andersonii.AAC.1
MGGQGQPCVLLAVVGAVAEEQQVSLVVLAEVGVPQQRAQHLLRALEHGDHAHGLGRWVEHR